ncbi:MAG TPA: hypothetical protein VF342_16450 [Alphaproteobacteria bacterium]
MTREDLVALIVDALKRAEYVPRVTDEIRADLILRTLKAAGVKMRGPHDFRPPDGPPPDVRHQLRLLTMDERGRKRQDQLR